MYIFSCQPRTVYKKGKIEIDFYDKYRCLHLSWSGQISPEEYTAMLKEMLAICKRLKASFIIFDAREEEDLLLYDPEWTIAFFKEEVTKHQIKKIARLASPDFHNETKMSSFATKLFKDNKLPIEFKYLPDTNHAISWFLEPDGQATN